MTIRELKELLSQYDEEAEVKFAQYGDGIVERIFDIDGVADYTDQEKPYVLIL
jgi:hypothetical protein